MNRLQEAFKRLLGVWSPLSRLQKASIVGTALLLLVAFGGLFTFAGKTEYEPLFSGLRVEDQAAIVEDLKERKVDYRLDPAASAILVPADSVYDLRLSLAGNGLPKGGTVGFELFDEAKMGMTDFQQQVAYMRALEGELSRTISQINCVDSARVSIVMSRQKLFLRQEEPGSASVLVKLRPGRDMGVEQVRAIAHLTAYSVEGLSPENVSVVDTSGRLLSDMTQEDYLVYPGSSGGAVSSLQRELEKRQEKDLERKAQRMLEAIFGPGNSIVRVRVELDFAKRNRTRQQFIPQANGKGVVRSRQVTEEDYTGSARPDQAVGTATNIPGYATRSGGTESGNYNKVDEVTNYEVSTLHQEETEAPGAVKRITASVVINGQGDAAGLRDDLYASVATAIGLDEQRGDRLSLSFMEFAEDTADLLAAEAVPAGMLPFSPLWLLVPAGLALAGGAIFLLRRRRKQSGQVSEELEMEEDGTGQKVMAGLANLEKGNQDEMFVLEEQIGLYAENNPEDLAVILKQWLDEAY